MSALSISLIVLVLVIGASIIWSTITSGISPMPSSKPAREAMMQLTEETGNGPIFDLGCGWGHLIILVALKHPHRQIVGYEVSLLPWLTATVLKKILGLKNLMIHREDFLDADLSSASVILCYLYPAAMAAIKNKLESESNKTLFLISNNFALPAQQPDKIIQLDDFYRSPVYLYQMAE